MSRKHKKSNGRDGTAFVALPIVVLDCENYVNLSFSGKGLLIELAFQYKGSNNGKLVICDKALKPRGWTSPATIHKAKRELLNAGFICETRKGQKPNKASWFAITWQTLDWSPEMDIRREGFTKGAYAKTNPDPQKMK